jgi:hypothetical protein
MYQAYVEDLKNVKRTGRKTMVVITDGDDNRYQFDQTLWNDAQGKRPNHSERQPWSRGGTAWQGLAFGTGEPERVDVPPDGVIGPAHARLPTRIAST